MDADLILKTVQNYLKVLEDHPSILADASHLPTSKETLKRSIQSLWFVLDENDMKIRKSLKTAFLYLANFQTDISPGFEDLFQDCQNESTSKGGSIEARFRQLAKEKYPKETEWRMTLREKEMKALSKEIALWENNEFG